MKTTPKKNSKAALSSIPGFFQPWVKNGNFKYYSPKNKKISSLTKLNSNFLEFSDEEASDFLKPLNKLLTPSLTVSNLSESDRIRLITFGLIKMARFLAPKDNNEFLFKILIPLMQNPMVSHLVENVVKLSTYTLQKGKINLPELGVFIAPNTTNKYTYVIPLSPDKVLLVYVGEDPLFTSDEALIDLSYSTTEHAIMLTPDSTVSEQIILKKQKSNEAKIGDLSEQIKDPKPIMSILRALILSLPGIKGSRLLSKPIEMALRFWQSK